MSYTESFSRTIAVHYSGTVTVNYPASEHGGSTTASYSGTAYEQVDVDIHVDTAPFDASVANCNNHVNGLTASVGAMNTAQCIAIRKNADKVSKALIDGFFHTVRTDMGTQKAELEQVINARLLLLRQQATSLKAIQDTMAEDYARTTARYQKIFNDLNRELSNRIHEIDQPVFKLVEGVEKQNDRMLHTDMVQTVATISKESSVLQAQVNTASVKNPYTPGDDSSSELPHVKSPFCPGNSRYLHRWKWKGWLLGSRMLYENRIGESSGRTPMSGS